MRIETRTGVQGFRRHQGNINLKSETSTCNLELNHQHEHNNPGFQRGQAGTSTKLTPEVAEEDVAIIPECLPNSPAARWATAWKGKA